MAPMFAQIYVKSLIVDLLALTSAWRNWALTRTIATVAGSDAWAASVQVCLAALAALQLSSGGETACPCFAGWQDLVWRHIQDPSYKTRATCKSCNLPAAPACVPTTAFVRSA